MASERNRDSGKVTIKDFSIQLEKTPNSSAASSNRTTPENDNEEIMDNSSPDPGLQIDTGQPLGEDNSDTDSLSDLPPEALKATTKAQFTSHMRHFVWLQYPSATASEHNTIIVKKWKELVTSRKAQSGGNARRRSEVDSLGGEDPQDDPEGSGRRSSRRRAARNISQTAYTLDDDILDYADSPASSANSRDTGRVSRKRGRRKTQSVGASRGRGKRIKTGPKVPPMKIKMIGRSGESDSPIFFAESVESWDEGSDSERVAGMLRDERLTKLKAPPDSETSSIDFNEIEGTSGLEEGEEEDNVEDMDVSADSAGEHADFCFTCKDGGELLCCDHCPLAYHTTCLLPPMEVIPVGDWKCPRCEAEPLKCKVEKIYAWRWTTLPVPGEVEAMEDDAIATDNGSKSPTKPKTYRFREFLVKWRGKSHWKDSWIPEIRLSVHQPITLRSYMRPRDMETPPTLELPPDVQRRHRRRSTASHTDGGLEELEMMLLSAGIRPQWLQIHRIINKRSGGRNGSVYLVKWKELPYTSATWETLDSECGLKGATEAVQNFNKLKKLMDPKKLEKKDKRRGRKSQNSGRSGIVKYEEQPDFISVTGGSLHPYQLEGLNWLRFSWSQGTNTILADEMGLGKTIQTISFLYSLYKEGYSNGPFLVTAPLSTIVNWERELVSWAPELYVVTYYGDRENRAAIREHEFTFLEGVIKKSKRMKMKRDTPYKFHVLLTSYEFISVDSTILGSVNWEVLVVDEAHRLKNNQSKFFKVLSNYDLKYKLLLTGTPLQNNLEELFHLLNFLNPQDFNSLEEFQDEFEDISKEDQVSKLHELLAPHLLRRLKTDVLKNIPPKRELIVRVELSPMQKKYYRWILTKNFQKLNTRGSQPMSLLNVMMDLKKCCNHPYLFPLASLEAPLTATGYYEGTSLVKAAGKFIVLEKMLRKLQKQGHRVLIFSQMTRMLDILEDFLEYLGLGFERIDGNIQGSERQRSIDRFNTPGSKNFVFLLSTRAGGLGINLASADTVIIYDSDWNPHNDIQAFSRAHRIGQCNKVMIYRFVTRASVEERITEVAKKKMMLTHLVVRPGMGSGANAPSLSKRELDDILRFGTEDLFKEEGADDDSTTIHYDNRAIEALLDRTSDAGVETDGAIGSENLLANDYLSSFKVASYVMKETDEDPETEILATEGETSQKPDPDFWEKLLRHHYEQQAEVEAAKLGKGKRVRKQVNYLDASMGGAHDSDQSSYQQSEEEPSGEGSSSEDDFTGTSNKKKLKSKLAKMDATLPPLLAKVNDTLYVFGFNPRQRKAFLNAVMRWGVPPPDAYEHKWRTKELTSIPKNAFDAYTNLFMRHMCEPDDSKRDTFSDGVPKENLPRQNILSRIGTIRLIKNKIEQYDEINGTHSMPEVIVQPSPPQAPDSTEEKMDTSDSKTDLTETISIPDSEDKDSKSPSLSREQSNSTSPEKSSETSKSSESSPKDSVKHAGVIVDPVDKTEDKPSPQKFMFNIADGGFTDIHHLWAQEKKKGYTPKTWGRRHDYWLLKGATQLGYCRWTEICNDPRFAILNLPFPESGDGKSVPDSKAKFMVKRFKLLEHALSVEEQLHRASSCGLVQDPSHHVMQLHSRFTDLDCLVDGHTPVVTEAMDKKKNSILLLKKALSKMDELLMEMKTDVSRLPNELSKLPLVSKQLKIDEISTISKLAKGSTIVPQSVITQAPSQSAESAKQERSDVIVVQKNKKEIQPGAQNPTQLQPGSGAALQTAVLYSANSKQAQQSNIVKTVAPSSTAAAYTIGMPSTTLLDSGSGVYQAVQLVPVSATPSQQLMYWPGISGQQVKVGSQITMVDPKPKPKPKGKGVITIDD